VWGALLGQSFLGWRTRPGRTGRGGLIFDFYVGWAILSGEKAEGKRSNERSDEMGGKKIAGIALLVVGILVLILSLIADLVGIGGSPVFGYKQIVGSVAGVVAIVVGLFLALRK
jgi:hypothetical protein